MTALEQSDEIRSGDHWLCRLADDLEFDILDFLGGRVVSEPNRWQYDARQIAIEMVELHQERQGIEPRAIVKFACYPWEKSRIIRAAHPEKLHQWARKVLIEAADKKAE